MAELETLRERRDALQLEHEVAGLQAEIAAMESEQRAAQLLEVGQVVGSRTGYLYDHPGFGGPGIQSPSDSVYGVFHVDRVDDRLDGRYRPVYENETHLAEQRGVARVLASVDEHAIGTVEALGNYTLGTGYTYEATPRKPEDQAAVEVAAVCQEIIDEFVDRDEVHWRRKEREFHHRSRRDGETFLQIYPIGGGRADCEFAEPAEITEPTNPNDLSEFAGFVALDWTMGVATDFGRYTRVHGYFRDMSGDEVDSDYVPASRMVHAKRNVDERAKRGVSDFYPVWRDMERAAKVLRNTGEGASLQAAIAFIREHVPGTSLSAVQSMSAGKLVAEVDRRWPSGNSTQTKYRRYNPGTILDVPAGQQYKPGPMGAERNEGFVTVADALWRATGVRWNMPEYMITGDPSNGSFASTLIAESPFVKAREADQTWYEEEFLRVMWAILAIAINDSPVFAQRGITSLVALKRVIKLVAEPPRVSVRNRSEDTQVSAVLNAAGLLSKRTWAAKEDLDYDQEQAQLKEEPAPPAGAGSGFGQFDPFGRPVGPAQGGPLSFTSAPFTGPGGEQQRPLGRVLGSGAEPKPSITLPESRGVWEGYP